MLDTIAIDQQQARRFRHGHALRGLRLRASGCMPPVPCLLPLRAHDSPPGSTSAPRKTSFRAHAYAAFLSSRRQGSW